MGPPVPFSALPEDVASLSGYDDRVVGCLLSKMCGDVLGAAVEGWGAEDVRLSHPEGLTSFLHTERGFGCYTDDTQMAIALAKSLNACGGRINDVHAARCYAEEYHPCRGYGGTAYKILMRIKQYGIDATSIATIGTQYIPQGSFGNGGAMRIAPVGLVYRHAPPAVLRAAVAAALRCTHVHPTAVDGAFAVALAVGYLATREAGPGPGSATGAPATAGATSAAPATAGATSAAAANAGATGGSENGGAGRGTGIAPARGGSRPGTEAGALAGVVSAVAAADGRCAGGGGQGDGGGGQGDGGAATPVGLLDYLLSNAHLMERDETATKLRAVKAALLRATRFKTPGEPWAAYFASPGWELELQLHAQVSEPFQIRADDAAAVALAALCWHWSCPEDAVVAAVHYGGDTDTVAAITGALAGALHGAKWIPARWFDQLENGSAGRDELLRLALELSRFDSRT